MKSIIVVHGDKGGVGKSTFSALVFDFLLHQYGSAVLVEGDATIFDVAPRFDGVDGAKILAVDLARQDMSEEAIVSLFSEIESGAGDAEHVLINTPASAGKTLDAQADLIADAVSGLGYRLIVAWMIDIGEDSARLSMQSELCRMADVRVAVQNERVKKADLLPWHNHAARDAWLASGGSEIVLPGLSERVAGRIRDIQTPFSTMLDADNGLTIIERAAVKRWVNCSWTEIGKVFNGGAS